MVLQGASWRALTDVMTEKQKSIWPSSSSGRLLGPEEDARGLVSSIPVQGVPA